ncbi:MAG: FliI/YscN family ATPase, partial [Pseudomonadota bacterium]
MTVCAQIISSIEASRFAEFFGQVTAIGQQSLTANGPHCRIGDICQIGSGDNIVLAQVVAVKANRVECMTFHTTDQVRVGDRVCLSTKHSSLPSGDKFQGRVIDAFGNPIDDGGPILAAHSSQPKSNANLSKCIEPVRVRTGIRAIDGIIPLAKGQRIGIFAASGVGKTTLIEQLSTRIDCDKVVVCLIGERG